jgi:ABC-2 type transport system permease protein
MINILTIARYQVLAQLSNRGELITLFVVPILMILAIGTFNAGAAPTRTWRLEIERPPDPDPYIDQYLRLLEQAFAQSVGYKLVLCQAGAPNPPAACQDDSAEGGRAFVESGARFALLTFPADFSQQLAAGQKTALTIYMRAGNPSDQQTLANYLQTVNTRLSSTLEGARLVQATLGQDTAYLETLVSRANDLWAAPPIEISSSFSTLTGTAEGSGFAQSVPGIGGMFVLINALALPQLFISERKQWTLQRLQMMPLRRGQLLAGKLLGQFSLGLITFAVMLVAGVVFGMRLGDPLAMLLLIVAYTLAATAIGLAVATFTKTVGQAAGLGLLIPMMAASLGGGWWPLSITPPFMQSLGLLSPIAWLQRGFSQLVYYGKSLGDIWPAVAVLVGFAGLFFAIGLARFRLD